ncbi:hypothetical protein [Almyronema epifaneia]|uniref:Uncharacterized protein n=1 Tax=Almyronema epifaneia S1 TaxID=2991925 RepID=A0ABW6IJR2_9CYAN
MSNFKEMARYSLEISDEEKQRIETCRSDLSWKELSFGAKLRVLVFERVEALSQPNSANESNSK